MIVKNDDTLELGEKPHKITGRKPESEIKQAAMLVLEENGFSHSAIAKAIGYHEKSVSRALPKIRKESLAHPRKLKLASKCAEKIMTGFLGEKDKDGSIVTDPRVKASDAARVTELVYKSAGELDRDSGQGASTQLFFQVNQQFINALGSVIEDADREAGKGKV